MNRKKHILLVSVITSAIALAGCASTTSESADIPASTAPAQAAEPSEVASTPTESAVSDIEAAVATFVGALDELGIEHSEPVRADVQGSGAKARFDITVNSFPAGINVFPDADTLAAWGKLSDSFGGIYVQAGNAVLTLNSSDGIANSADIAPRIAEAVGGSARGV